MQIDFHHGVTYVCARLAGFPSEKAEAIAHSAQYVDDATASGEIWFDNGMLFERTASAHKMLDYRNSKELANHRVWLPFHFLPGNRGEPIPRALSNLTKEEFLLRCICRPNSPPAQDMMKAVIARQDRPYALYRLGVAAHVYVDTWAHQGFVGYQHKVNIATDLEANDTHHERSYAARVKDFFNEEYDHIKGKFVGEVLPLGHGTVLSYPDRPYLSWSYTNGLGEKVVRNNPQEFEEAAQHLFQQFRRYLEYPEVGDGVFAKNYPLSERFDRIGGHLRDIKDEDGEERHKKWLALIRDGEFGFAEPVDYVEKGEGSWKYEALGTIEDISTNRTDPIPFPAAFQTSHWKLFHDALQAHRFYVLHELLPSYGLLSG
jgi:hypothetical protein